MNNFWPFFIDSIIALSVYLLAYQIMLFLRFHTKKISAFVIDNNAKGLLFIDRIKLHPTLAKISKKESLGELVVVAGLSYEWTAHRFAVLRLLSWVIGFALALILVVQGKGLAAVLLVALASYWPEVLLRQYIKRRKRYAEKTLSEIIDLLRLQTNIGLNLEQSFTNLTGARKDLWKREFNRLNSETANGLPLVVALQRLSERFAIEDLNRFTLAIKQAKQLGASISETLVIQSEQLKIRRRLRAEQLAKVASVKITFPLVFFIFPALLIVYLAPAMITFLGLK